MSEFYKISDESSENVFTLLHPPTEWEKEQYHLQAYNERKRKDKGERK